MTSKIKGNRAYPKRRVYLLDGVEIKSSECDGMLHKSRITHDENNKCPECDKIIEAGQEYVIYLHYLDSPLWHKDCWLSPRQNPTILGISTTKIAKYGTMRTAVICKKFMPITEVITQ